MTARLLAVLCRDAVYCRALNTTNRQLWSFPPRYPGRCVQHVGSCSRVIKASGIPDGHISVVRTCRSRNVEFLNTWAYRQSLSHERGKSHVWATHSLHTHLLASLRPIKPTIERGHMIRSWAGGARGWSQMSGEEQKMEKKCLLSVGDSRAHAGFLPDLFASVFREVLRNPRKALFRNQIFLPAAHAHISSTSWWLRGGEQKHVDNYKTLLYIKTQYL